MINTAQIALSLYGSGLDPISDRLEVLHYGREPVPVLFMSSYLEQKFGARFPQTNPVVLIADRGKFCPEVKKKIRQLCHAVPSEDYLGLKIFGEVGIETISLEKLRPLPMGIRETQHRKGVLALRFREEGMDYLIEIEKAVMGILEMDSGIRQ